MDGVQRIGICWSFPRDWPDLGAEAVGDDPTDYYTLTNCNENTKHKRKFKNYLIVDFNTLYF